MIGSRQSQISYSCIEQLLNDINFITLNQTVIFETLIIISLDTLIAKNGICGIMIAKHVTLGAIHVLEMMNFIASLETTQDMTFMKEELHVQNNAVMVGY